MNGSGDEIGKVKIGRIQSKMNDCFPGVRKVKKLTERGNVLGAHDILQHDF